MLGGRNPIAWLATPTNKSNLIIIFYTKKCFLPTQVVEMKKKRKRKGRSDVRIPNQQHTLNKLPTELRCRNFVSEHRPSMQICAKRAKTSTQSACIPAELPFLHVTVGGWVDAHCLLDTRTRGRDRETGTPKHMWIIRQRKRKKKKDDDAGDSTRPDQR